MVIIAGTPKELTALATEMQGRRTEKPNGTTREDLIHSYEWYLANRKGTTAPGQEKISRILERRLARLKDGCSFNEVLS